MNPLPLAFAPRPEPAEPRAVFALGDVAVRVALRLLEAEDDRLARLRGVGGDGALVILGEETDLPWVDGVTYLGASSEEPALYLPTTLEPDVPRSWLASVVERAGAVLPAAIVPGASGLDVIPLREARPLARPRLRAFLESSP